MGITERKEREKEQRRQDILDAAERVFFSKGLEKSTIDDVAQEAELSKGTLYLYFKGKDDLRFGIFLRSAEMLLEKMNRVITEDKNGLENLLAVGMVFINFSQENADYFKMFIQYQSFNFDQVSLDTEQLTVYFTTQSPFALITKIVETGIEDGSLRNDINLKILAATLWSQTIGLFAVLTTKQDIHSFFGIQPEDVIKAHFEVLVFGGINRNLITQ